MGHHSFQSLARLVCGVVLLLVVYLPITGQAQQSPSGPQSSSVLLKAVTERLSSSDWGAPDEQFLALLAGQKAAVLNQEFTVKGRPFFNSPLLSDESVREGISSAIWLEALLGIVSPRFDIKLRASLGKLLLLQPNQRAEALRSLPSEELTPLLAQLEASSRQIKDGVFTGAPATFTSKYPALTVYLLSDEGRSIEREFAEGKALLPRLGELTALKEILATSTLADPALQNVDDLLGVEQSSDRLKRASILRALQLLYAASVEYQPDVGLIGGPVQKAYELTALGVSDRSAINEAFIRAPTRITRELQQAQQQLFSRGGGSLIRQVREIQTRRDGLSGLSSFINLYRRPDSQGFIGDISLPAGRRKFKNVYGLCGPNGGLTQLFMELTRSTSAPSPTPAPAASPVPGFQRGAGASLGVESTLLSRKTSATTYEFRRPGAPMGEGVLTANIPSDGPIELLSLSGITGVSESDTELLRAVMLRYPTRQFRTQVTQNSPEMKKVAAALWDNPVNPELRGIPFVAAREGKISIEVDGSAVTLLSTPGQATYWGDRPLLTRSASGMRWLIDQGILPDSSVKARTVSSNAGSAKRRAKPAGLPDEKRLTERPPSAEAVDLATEHLSALINKKFPPISYLEFVSTFTPDELALYNALIDKTTSPPGLSALQRAQLNQSINLKIAQAIDAQFIRPLDLYMTDLRAGADRELPGLTGEALETELSARRATLLREGDVEGLFSKSMRLTYRNLRLPAAPYGYEKEIYIRAESYVNTNEALVTFPQGPWLYRGEDIGTKPIIQRGSLNVSVSQELVKELDQLILDGKFNGYYKFGSTKYGDSSALGWRRHDSVTLYFNEELSTEARGALADIATRYGRGVHDLLGEKVVDGFSLTVNVPDSLLPKAVEDVAKINPVIGSALKERLSRPDTGDLAISEGLYEAARETLRRFKIAFNMTTSGLVVDRASGMASQEVFALASDSGPRIVDRRAIEAFESISRNIRANDLDLPIAKKSDELNIVWKEMLRRVVLPDVYIVSPMEIINPSKIPRGSAKFAEFEAFKDDYEAIRRRLMTLKGEIYEADLARLNLIKQFHADSENRIYVTSDFEASANPVRKEVRIGERLFQLDYLAHEMAAMNLPKQLHLYNLVKGSVGPDGKLPAHIDPFFTILDELISVTAEVSGRAPPIDVTRVVTERYATTMDNLVALHNATPRLFSASPDTLPADKLMVELQKILLEQTTRPLNALLDDFHDGGLPAAKFKEGVAQFGDRVGWRPEVLEALGRMDPDTLHFVLRGVPLAGFNALAQKGDLNFRSPEAAVRFQQVLEEGSAMTQVLRAIEGAIIAGLTKSLNANDLVGISANLSDSFWTDWKHGEVRSGYEFPISGPTDSSKLNTLKTAVYTSRANPNKPWARDYTIGERSWFDALTIEGVRYEGRFKLVFKVDQGGNLPPQYKLTFAAEGRNIQLRGENGPVTEVVLIRPAALANRDSFSLSQMVPYSNDEGGAFKRAALAVHRGVFTQAQLEMIAGGHIRPRVVVEALASQNPISLFSGGGHQEAATLRSLIAMVPPVTDVMVASVQAEVAAMAAARGVEITGAYPSSREGLTSGLMEQLKWPKEARGVLDALSPDQVRAVLSDNFAAFNAAAQRGDLEAMRVIAKVSFDPTSSSSILRQILRGGILTRVPKGLGMSGDLELVLRVRERFLKAPELTKTQRWALETGFKQLAREPLTDAERTNLVKLVEFLERGGKLSLPSQLFGGDTAFTPREVISRAAYLNWAGEDRSTWKDPTKLYQLLLEANMLATEASHELTSDSLQRAITLTRGEMGLLGERFNPSVGGKIDRLNAGDHYQFLSTYNQQATRGVDTAVTLVERWKSDVGTSPKVPPSRVWDPVLATGERTSSPSSTAKAYLELRDARNNLVWKGDVGRDYNFGNVDAFQVKIRNYHSDPLLPDLVAEQVAGAALPANRWLDQAAPGAISATQARVAYTDARTADAITAVTSDSSARKPGGQLVPEGLASRYGEVEVHSGVEPGRGRFTEVVMHREPQGGESFRERFESLHAVELGFNPPAARFGDAPSFDLAHAPSPASTHFSRRALRGAAFGANLVLDYVALDAAMFSYFQGASAAEIARSVADETINQFKSPEFYAITGTQYLLNAAAASQIPAVAAAGGYLAPVVTTAMVSFGVTTLGMNAAWAYQHAPEDRRNMAWDVVLTPFKVQNAVSDMVSDHVFFPAILLGSDVTREQIHNDPYMMEFLSSIDQQSPGENLASVFGIQPDFDNNPTVEDAINRILQENETSPFLFESEGGEEVKKFAESLLASPESEWKDRINFRRDVNAIAMGDTNRNLVNYLPYDQRMGAGEGTNLPQGSWLATNSSADSIQSGQPLYINPPAKTIDMSNWKLLSLDELWTQPVDAGATATDSLGSAVEAVADPQQLGGGITFPIAAGESVQQYAEQHEQASEANPESPEWWSGATLPPQNPYGPDGYDADVFDDAAAGTIDSSSDDPPWESGQYGNATYENGIQLNGSCVDPTTGEKVPC